MPKPRIRDLGYGPGFYEPGPRNSILDIPGLQLGQKTIYDPDNGIHVGVTIFFPRGTTNTRTKPSYAAIFSLNGAGELTGNHFIDNWGFTNSPIAFTDSMSIGAVYQSLVTHGWGVSRELGEDPETGYAHFGFPVVGETWGGGVTDIQGGKSTLSHEQVMEAIKDAEVRQAVGEGGQGGGAGRETLGWDEAEASFIATTVDPTAFTPTISDHKLAVSINLCTGSHSKHHQNSGGNYSKHLPLPNSTTSGEMAPADDLSTSSSGGSGDIFRHSPGTHDGEEETKRHMKTLEGLCHLYKLRAEDKEKRIVEIEQRIEQLERELAQCYASGEKLISTNASLQSMLDEREKSPDDRHSLCKGEADAKNKRIEELQQQKARLEEELDRCFASGEKLISSHTSLQETASSQEKSLAELHKLLKGEGSKNQDRVEDLQRQLGRREQELEQCFASGEKLISANAFLQRLVQERDARLTEQTSYIKRLEEEVGLRKEAVVRTEARPVSLCHVKADVGVMVKANGEEG